MDTSKIIYTKSKEHFGKGNKFWIYHIDFLKKISNINIFTFIVVSLEQISFNILSQTNPNNLLFRYVYKLNSYSENSINAFINLIKKIISGLEFDKLIGVFISKNVKLQKPLFFDEFGLDYIDKNTCIVCSEQTVSKLKCNHFCCAYCFDNNLTNKECCGCKKKSTLLINQFKYYSIENIEIKWIKIWIKSNEFFQNIIFNFKNQFNIDINADDYNYDDDDDDDDEEYNDDEEDDDEEDEEDDEEENDDENWEDDDDEQINNQIINNIHNDNEEI